VCCYSNAAISPRGRLKRVLVPRGMSKAAHLHMLAHIAPSDNHAQLIPYHKPYRYSCQRRIARQRSISRGG